MLMRASLALQGPAAAAILAELFPLLPEIAPMHFAQLVLEKGELIISHTGYTGSGGVEFYVPLAILRRALGSPVRPWQG